MHSFDKMLYCLRRKGFDYGFYIFWINETTERSNIKTTENIHCETLSNLRQLFSPK